MSGLTFSRGRRPILSNFSMHARRGERVRLAGPVGSGKTTLLRLILGTNRYQAGTILVGGHDIAATSARSLRRAIVYVPQQPTLFDRTLYENVSYGTDATREQVAARLREYGVDYVGMDEKLGRRGSRLSGGQRQIVYLIRCLFREDAPLLLLDEPTASLDPDARKVVLRLLDQVMGSRTVLMATHDPDLARMATREVSVG